MDTDNNGENNGKSSDWHDAATGRFKKCNPGRQPGSKNKLRDTIRKFIDEQWESFPQWFDGLKPPQKIEVMLSLLPYCVSRLQSVTLADDEGNPIQQGIDLSVWSSEDLRLLISLKKKYAIIDNQE